MITEKLKELHTAATNKDIIEWQNDNGDWEEIDFRRISIGAFIKNPNNFRVKRELKRMWTIPSGEKTTDEFIAKCLKDRGYEVTEWVEVIK
jgi:hypothetical protein